MALSKEERANQEPDAWGVDEIDWRGWVDTVLRWRWHILGSVVLVFVVVILALIAMARLKQPTYEATATVVMARVASDVSFDPRFKTDTELQQTDLKARRATLLGLVSSGAIAETVAKELAGSLPAEAAKPEALLQSVRGVITAQSPANGSQPATSDLNSDLIRIVARGASPDQAAAVANAWAHAYVDQVNALYGEGASTLSPSVEAQLAKAQSEYETAQQALEKFTASSRLESERREANMLLTQVNVYSRTLSLNQTLVLEKVQQGHRDYISALLDAQQNARQQVLSERYQSDARALTAAYDAQLETGRLLDNAKTLRAQVAAGGENAAASGGLALQVLKMQAFAPLNASAFRLPAESQDPGRTSQLQLQLPQAQPASAAATLADVDGLIQALSDRQQSLKDRIDALTKALLAQEQGVDAAAQQQEDGGQLAKALQAEFEQLAAAPTNLAGNGDSSAAGSPALSDALAALEVKLSEVRAQIEADEARLRQLTQQRDLAWNTYQTLSNKVAELRVAGAAGNTEVRLAAPALPPANPLPGPSPLRSGLLAAIVALVLTTIAARLADHLRDHAPQDARPAAEPSTARAGRAA